MNNFNNQLLLNILPLRAQLPTKMWSKITSALKSELTFKEAEIIYLKMKLFCLTDICKLERQESSLIFKLLRESVKLLSKKILGGNVYDFEFLNLRDKAGLFWMDVFRKSCDARGTQQTYMVSGAVFESTCENLFFCMCFSVLSAMYCPENRTETEEKQAIQSSWNSIGEKLIELLEANKPKQIPSLDKNHLLDRNCA